MGVQKQTTELYNHLIQSGIVKENVEQNRIIASKLFRDRRETIASDGRDRSREELFAELDIDPRDHEEAEYVSRDVLVSALAILDISSRITESESLRAAMSLDALEKRPAATPVPDAFTHLNPNQLSGFVSDTNTAMVLFWTQDCDPCSTLSDRLADLIDEDLFDGTELGAVRGDDNPDLLSDLYDVSVAPTMLFYADGSVYSRLVGLQQQSVIRREVEALR